MLSINGGLDHDQSRFLDIGVQSNWNRVGPTKLRYFWLKNVYDVSTYTASRSFLLPSTSFKRDVNKGVGTYLLWFCVLPSGRFCKYLCPLPQPIGTYLPKRTTAGQRPTNTITNFTRTTYNFFIGMESSLMTRCFPSALKRIMVNPIVSHISLLRKNLNCEPGNPHSTWEVER